nr:hypothetical protein [Lachnospiraceae bacterium]
MKESLIKEDAHNMIRRIMKLLVFLFVLAAAFVPAAGVMAADYDYEVDLSRIGSLRGKLVQPGDII